MPRVHKVEPRLEPFRDDFADELGGEGTSREHVHELFVGKVGKVGVGESGPKKEGWGIEKT